MPNVQPTLEDVARLAGVSTATVSRVLNTPERVKSETREKVAAIVAQLGYTPHFAARVLASSRTHTIGAIIPTMENAIFARGLQALEEALARAGVTLLVATSNYDPETEASQVRVLIGRGVDQLVLIGEARDAATYDLLERRGIPFVILWIWRADCPWSCAGFDNRASAQMIAERVLDLGHRDIGMIAGITRGNDRAAARVEGVRSAMRRRGLEMEADRLVEARYSLEDGAAAARELLASRRRPTAILCGNDVLAAGAYIAMRDAGLRIPHDISITGFDDIDLAVVLEPPLTTVHVPHRRMGEAAAELLLEHRTDDDEPRRIEIKTTLVERGSLAGRPQGSPG